MCCLMLFEVMLTGAFEGVVWCWEVCLKVLSHVDMYVWRCCLMLRGVFGDVVLSWQLCLNVSLVDMCVQRYYLKLTGMFEGVTACWQVCLKVLPHVDRCVWRCFFMLTGVFASLALTCLTITLAVHLYIFTHEALWARSFHDYIVWV